MRVFRHKTVADPSPIGRLSVNEIRVKYDRDLGQGVARLGSSHSIDRCAANESGRPKGAGHI